MPERRRPERVVVGVDGSYAGLAATRWAAAEAAQRQVELRIVQVQAPRPEGITCAAYGVSLDAARGSRAAEVINRAVREVRLAAPGLPVTGEVIFGNVVAGLVAAGCQSQLLVLGSRGLLSRSLARSWSCAAAVASKAPVPVTVVEPSVYGDPVSPARNGAVAVLTADIAGIDRLLDYGCAQAERRGAMMDVIAAIGPRRGTRDRARIAAEQALFDALVRGRDRWPAVHLAGLVSTAKDDADVRCRLSRADLVVIDGHRARSLMRRCQLAGPLGMRSGPCAMTVLPS